MSESIFGDKTKKPDVPELENALGKSMVLLKKIELHLQGQYGTIEREWKFYSKKTGWTFALVDDGKKIIAFDPS